MGLATWLKKYLEAPVVNEQKFRSYKQNLNSETTWKVLASKRLFKSVTSVLAESELFSITLSPITESNEFWTKASEPFPIIHAITEVLDANAFLVIFLVASCSLLLYLIKKNNNKITHVLVIMCAGNNLNVLEIIKLSPCATIFRFTATLSFTPMGTPHGEFCFSTNGSSFSHSLLFLNVALNCLNSNNSASASITMSLPHNSSPNSSFYIKQKMKLDWASLPQPFLIRTQTVTNLNSFLPF